MTPTELPNVDRNIYKLPVLNVAQGLTGNAEFFRVETGGTVNVSGTRIFLSRRHIQMCRMRTVCANSTPMASMGVKWRLPTRGGRRSGRRKLT